MRYDTFHPGQVWLDTEKTEMYEKYLDPTLSAEERADDLLSENEFGRKICADTVWICGAAFGRWSISVWDGAGFLSVCEHAENTGRGGNCDRGIAETDHGGKPASYPGNFPCGDGNRIFASGSN